MTGYKEFSEYLDRLEDDSLAHETISPDFKAAVEATKLGTRQYARRQIKWIRNQLILVVEACKRQSQPSEVYLYLLDATCTCTIQILATPSV